MSTLARDFRYAFRLLAKSPGFTAVVVLSLALGIGANTAIFSVVNAYLLRPMPVDHPDRLAAIYVTSPRWGNLIGGFSYPDLVDYRKTDTGLSELMGSGGAPLSITDGDKPEMIWGEFATGNFFSGLGVHPVLGRGFTADEDRVPGEKPVCILGYNFWRRRFQGDPNIAGQSLRINGHAFTIVGVAPRGFIGTTLFEFIPDVWIPVMMQHTLASDDGLTDRGSRWISVRGRLQPGVSLAQAEAALNVAARQMAAEYPKTNGDLTVHLIPGGTRTNVWLVASGLMSATTGILAAVVILVLLIACSNVANLMLVRSAGRAREMAIRVAVGATRARLIRQLLAESVLLALVGGAMAIILAMWFNDVLTHFYPSMDFQTADLSYETRLDPRLFPFTILISFVSAMVFGLAPALRASKVDQVTAMKRTRIGSGNLLVMAQVALSSVLLICGGLFLRSVQFAGRTDPGFDRAGITMFSINLDPLGYDAARGQTFRETLLDRLRTIPSVESVTAAFPLPLDAYDSSTEIFPEGYVPRSDREQNAAGYSGVGAHYFETMGTPLVAGRAMNDRDTSSSKRVAVINETMARRYWHSADGALGRRFAADRGGTPMEVIGVAKDGKYHTFGEGATSYYFVPLAQRYRGLMHIVVRSKAGEDSLIPLVQEELKALDPSLPIFGVRTVPQFLNRLLSIYELGASLVGTFAVMALLLAAVGIYGVLHYTVAQRTREIGIRMALGAKIGQVLRLVLRRSLLFVGAGLALGVVIAAGGGRVTGMLVAGVSGTDPATFGAAVLLFLLIALIASLMPARRAARVDPVRALHHE